jgi:hypothetical protein
MSSLKVLFIALVCLQAVLGSSVSTQQHPEWRHNLRSQVTKLGLSADVTATIEESLFVKICNTVVPLINQYVQGLTIPGLSGSHFSFDAVVIQQFNIQSIGVTFAAPSTIQLSLSDISFAIPHTSFDVFAKILFVHVKCSGDFWASMTGTSITFAMAASESSGSLVFGDAQTSVVWGNLNVNHKFNSVVCKIGQDIIQVFIGSVNNIVKNTIEKDVPLKVAPILQNALDAAMAKLPLDFVSQPQVTSDSISLTVDLLGHPAGATEKQRLRAARTVGIDPRDLELQIPATAVNNLLIVAQQDSLVRFNSSKPSFNTTAIKAIFPALYAQCPGCPFDIEIVSTIAPAVTMANDTITMAITQGVVGLNILSAGGSVIPFVDLWVNGTLNVDDVSISAANALYFQLSIANFNLAIRQSSIGPFDISLISSVVAFALNDVAIPDFNNRFSGVPLPSIAADAEVAVSDSSVYVGFNVNL